MRDFGLTWINPTRSKRQNAIPELISIRDGHSDHRPRGGDRVPLRCGPRKRERTSARITADVLLAGRLELGRCAAVEGSRQRMIDDDERAGTLILNSVIVEPPAGIAVV